MKNIISIRKVIVGIITSSFLSWAILKNNNFARLITPIEKETIDKLLLEFDEDVFKYAITIAVLNRKTLFSYVVGILNNWKSQNLKSLKDVKDYEKKYYCENRSSINENDETQIIDEDILNYNWFEDNSHSNSFDNLDTLKHFLKLSTHY